MAFGAPGIFYKGASPSIGGGTRRSSAAADPPDRRFGGSRREERPLLATSLVATSLFDGNSFAFTSPASLEGSRTLRWQERGVDALRIPSHRHPQTTLNQIGRSIPPRPGCSSSTRVNHSQGGTGARRGQRQLGANLKRSCERSRSTVPISASQFELGARRRFSSERNKGFR